ncbi:MAG: TetR/AcrR family transcriptional regulator [Acidimicrobiia bacterium]|nr:TetR/AcrR family transcriptional regulator [Acidimicrobiia bacterium]
MPRIRAESIEEHKTLTRRDILDAAAGLFRAQGYTETSLGDIASHVGIGRTTLYEYCADQEGILVALVQQELPGLMADLVADLPEDRSCRDRLRMLIERGLEFVSDDTRLGSMLMRELPNISKPAQREVRQAHFGLADAVVGVCSEGVASGEFRPMDPRIAGQLVYGLMMSASSGLLRSPEAKRQSREVSDALLAIVFEGLASG